MHNSVREGEINSSNVRVLIPDQWPHASGATVLIHGLTPGAGGLERPLPDRRRSHATFDLVKPTTQINVQTASDA